MFLFLLCMCCYFACMYACVPCVYLMPVEVRRRQWIPLDWTHRELWVSLLVLGIKNPSSLEEQPVLWTAEPSLLLPYYLSLILYFIQNWVLFKFKYTTICLTYLQDVLKSVQNGTCHSSCLTIHRAVKYQGFCFLLTNSFLIYHGPNFQIRVRRNLKLFQGRHGASYFCAKEAEAGGSQCPDQLRRYCQDPISKWRQKKKNSAIRLYASRLGMVTHL